MEILKIPDFEVEIKSVKRIKIVDFFIPQLHPKLSPKQKEAVELAVKNGYYEFPRKIDLEGLAKLSKVKRQTYQENLRRAEKKNDALPNRKSKLKKALYILNRK